MSVSLEVFLKSVSIAASCAAFSFLLYKTDFITEYARIFKLNRLFKIEEYYCEKILSNGDSSYFEFLNARYNTFLTKLMSCPYCLGFWLCVIFNSFELKALFSYYVYIVAYRLITIKIKWN